MATACLSIGLGYMIVGGIDDFIKIKLKRNEGLSALQKTPRTERNWACMTLSTPILTPSSA